jgi:hypothetical protein
MQHVQTLTCGADLADQAAVNKRCAELWDVASPAAAATFVAGGNGLRWAAAAAGGTQAWQAVLVGAAGCSKHGGRQHTHVQLAKAEAIPLSCCLAPSPALSAQIFEENVQLALLELHGCWSTAC